MLLQTDTAQTFLSVAEYAWGAETDDIPCRSVLAGGARDRLQATRHMRVSETKMQRQQEFSFSVVVRQTGSLEGRGAGDNLDELTGDDGLAGAVERQL